MGPPPPPSGPLGPAGPPGPVGESKRGGTVLVVLVVLLAVGAAVTFGVLALWPSDDDDGDAATESTATTGAGEDDGDGDDEPGTTESQVTPDVTSAPTTAFVARDLLRGGFGGAFVDLLAAAGNPAQLLEVTVYETYAFLAYRDPVDPAAIDERQWRDGEVGDATPNTGRDRVDADTEPRLFTPAELSPIGLELLVADAPNHYDVPTTVSHVIIDRFLPFDERVLVRVYTVPTDGRAGGGYVSYDLAGTVVNVCC